MATNILNTHDQNQDQDHDLFGLLQIKDAPVANMGGDNVQFTQTQPRSISIVDGEDGGVEEVDAEADAEYVYEGSPAPSEGDDDEDGDNTLQIKVGGRGTSTSLGHTRESITHKFRHSSRSHTRRASVDRRRDTRQTHKSHRSRRSHRISRTRQSHSSSVASPSVASAASATSTDDGDHGSHSRELELDDFVYGGGGGGRGGNRKSGRRRGHTTVLSSHRNNLATQLDTQWSKLVSSKLLAIHDASVGDCPQTMEVYKNFCLFNSHQLRPVMQLWMVHRLKSPTTSRRTFIRALSDQLRVWRHRIQSNTFRSQFLHSSVDREAVDTFLGTFRKLRTHYVDLCVVLKTSGRLLQKANQKFVKRMVRLFRQFDDKVKLKLVAIRGPFLRTQKHQNLVRDHQLTCDYKRLSTNLTTLSEWYEHMQRRMYGVSALVERPGFMKQQQRQQRPQPSQQPVHAQRTSKIVGSRHTRPSGRISSIQNIRKSSSRQQRQQRHQRNQHQNRLSSTTIVAHTDRQRLRKMTMSLCRRMNKFRDIIKEMRVRFKRDRDRDLDIGHTFASGSMRSSRDADLSGYVWTKHANRLTDLVTEWFAFETKYRTQLVLELVGVHEDLKTYENALVENMSDSKKLRDHLSTLREKSISYEQSLLDTSISEQKRHLSNSQLKALQVESGKIMQHIECRGRQKRTLLRRLTKARGLVRKTFGCLNKKAGSELGQTLLVTSTNVELQSGELTKTRRLNLRTRNMSVRENKRRCSHALATIVSEFKERCQQQIQGRRNQVIQIVHSMRSQSQKLIYPNVHDTHESLVYQSGTNNVVRNLLHLSRTLAEQSRQSATDDQQSNADGGGGDHSQISWFQLSCDTRLDVFKKLTESMLRVTQRRFVSRYTRGLRDLLREGVRGLEEKEESEEEEEEDDLKWSEEKGEDQGQRKAVRIVDGLELSSDEDEYVAGFDDVKHTGAPTVPMFSEFKQRQPPPPQQPQFSQQLQSQQPQYRTQQQPRQSHPQSRAPQQQQQFHPQPPPRHTDGRRELKFSNQSMATAPQTTQTRLDDFSLFQVDEGRRRGADGGDNTRNTGSRLQPPSSNPDQSFMNKSMFSALLLE